MTMDAGELYLFRDNLLKAREAVPEIMEELLVGEGVYAVKQAKSIAKNDSPDIINTGNYRNNWHAGDKAMVHTSNKEHDGSKLKSNGRTYWIDVYNNADYAKHIEFGFRSHFVPGKWEGNTFVYIKGYKPPKGETGGMYVGPKDGYVRGKFVLKRAIRRTEATQDARLQRKFTKKIKEYTERGLS